jgi:hypothetical protein
VPLTSTPAFAGGATRRAGIELGRRLGIGAGSEIPYDPNFSTKARDRRGNHLPFPPQLILGHELCHALAYGEGTMTSEDAADYRTDLDTSDPADPEMLTMSELEGRAIGTGKYTSAWPSENSLRADVNSLSSDPAWSHAWSQPRFDHWMLGAPVAGDPDLMNLRPGGP